jgi:hypothetical protein
MSNYLNHLAARALRRQEPVRPRLPSLFEPPAGAHVPLPAEAAEAEAVSFELRAEAPSTIQTPALRFAPPPDPRPPSPDVAAQTPAPSALRPAPLPSEAGREQHESGPAAHAWTREREAGGESPTPRAAAQGAEAAAPPRRTRAEAPAPVEVVRRVERGADEAGASSRAEKMMGGAGESARELARRVAALEATRADEQGRRDSHGAERDAFMHPAPPAAAAPPASPRGAAPPPARGFERRDEPPHVHVTIGRVDVRAVFPAPAAPPAAPAPRPAPQTLAEYLKRRERGRP